MSNLVVHALQVGGGSLALTSIPGGGGDYAGDLDLIGGWAPGLVISMTTLAEMVAVGAGDFGSDIQGRASRWAHLPVDDFSAPEGDFDGQWPPVSAAARHALSGGGRVLVHCRGGCGRSGMAVLRLMIECGEAPEPALKRLRAVRPCAVETEAQLLWAVAPARVATPE
ncbi:Dual specificity phosphatase, catalytic domain [Ruegeria intermedia]|uniref:Dual specificity phosphatase, catalytic domain n=1 Tax=Ruegeria intermedia TaxID=996115 RepID=A0A1M4YFG6_9RHOB|nr:protein-tyrosine phosphatase family protein [Ruegeria intermedia]SHF04252.1 Dual specificity phosphatase, catalytic domain [Ruegeria intermedia]